MEAGERIAKYRILSGSSLKTIALAAMIIDHIAVFLLAKTMFAVQPLFSVGSLSVTLYWICRKIGRIAFPIYVFLLSEGYTHTRSKFGYGRDLLIFALISELPWNLVHCGKLLYPSSQNVFFTLFMGYLAICLCELFEKDRDWKHLACLVAVFAVSFFFNADYGIRGVGFILLVYVLRSHRVAQALTGSSLFVDNAPYVFVSFLLINMYNGERGFIRAKALKYIYYVIYPLHILILWYIRAKQWGW